MARETMQQKDKRPQSKTKTSPSAQSSQSARTTQGSRGNAPDRQTPIQTSRDESQLSGQNQQNQQPQSRESLQQSGNIARRGMTAPIRGGVGSPLDLMQRMSEDMDRLLDQFGLGRSGFGLGSMLGPSFGSDVADRLQQFTGAASLWAPQVETARRGDRFLVRADLPGVNKDDVHVEVDNDVLTITGERRSEQQGERGGLFRSERSYGSFYRVIPLPDGVNADQCEAKFNDGVLEISLPAPKQEERKAKHIQIR